MKCLEKFCAQNEFIDENSDVFLGIIGWAAGGFEAGYLMSLTPETQNGRYVDTQLMRECVAPWGNSIAGEGNQEGMGSVLGPPVMLALFFYAAVTATFL
jgi:hypothetical protein